MNPIYLDHAATTPVRTEVREAMRPYLTESFGNPSSPHRWGRAAAKALWEARERVASVIDAHPTEIYFTRGGTESDNLAIIGSCVSMKCALGRPPRVAVTSVEHHAVIDSATSAAQRGDASGTPVILEVSPSGELDLDLLADMLKDRAWVVSVMWVNNETGILMPVAKACEIVERARSSANVGAVRLHTDAVQAIGKIPVSVSDVEVDLLSLTGHKIYGPKGTGALFVRRGLEISPLLVGGGQERGLRPGTEDVAGAVGLATAVELSDTERDTVGARLRSLRDGLETAILDSCPGASINASTAPRVTTVSSIHLPDANGQSIVFGLDVEGVACSGGSACSSGSSGSHVIDALYPGRGGATVRFSLGRDNTAEEIDAAVSALVRVLGRHSNGVLAS